MLRQLAGEFSGFFLYDEMLIRFIGLAIDSSLEPADLIGKPLINVGDKTVLKREPHDAREEYQSYCHGGRVPQRQSNLDRPQAHWSSNLMAYPIPRMVCSNFASPSVSIFARTRRMNASSVLLSTSASAPQIFSVSVSRDRT